MQHVPLINRFETTPKQGNPFSNQSKLQYALGQGSTQAPVIPSNATSETVFIKQAQKYMTQPSSPRSHKSAAKAFATTNCLTTDETAADSLLQLEDSWVQMPNDRKMSQRNGLGLAQKLDTAFSKVSNSNPMDTLDSIDVSIASTVAPKQYENYRIKQRVNRELAD